MKIKLKNVVLSAFALIIAFTVSSGLISAAGEKETLEIETYSFNRVQGTLDGPWADAVGEYVPVWRYTPEAEAEIHDSGRVLEHQYYRTVGSEDFVVYCLSLGKNAPTTVTEDVDLEIEYQRTLSLGYPNKVGADYGIDDVDLEWATAVALKIVDGRAWDSSGTLLPGKHLSLSDFDNGNLVQTFTRSYTIGGVEYDNYPIETGVTDEEIAAKQAHATKLKSVITQLVNAATDESITPTKLTFSTDAQTETIYEESNDAYKVKVGPYKLEAVGNPETLTTLVNAIGTDTSNLELKDVNGTTLTSVALNQEFYVHATVKKGASVNFSLNAELSNREVSYVMYTNDNIAEQDMAVAKIVKPEAKQAFAGDQTVLQTTSITFTKLDSKTNQPLAGVRFNLEELDAGFVGFAITDASGKITFDGLKPGATYLLIEDRPLDGYIKASEYTFKVDVDGNVTYEGEEALGNVIYNTKNKIVINKVDGEGNPLTGATFIVRNKDTKTAVEGVWAGGVYTIEGLAPGTYEILETMSPDGYLLNKTINEFTVLDDGNIEGVAIFNIINVKNGFVITKVDTADGKLLAGATFELTDVNGKVLTFTTDANGQIKIEGLAFGKYTLKESVAPEGYDLETRVYEITVNENGFFVGLNDTPITEFELGNSKTPIVEVKEFEVEFIKVDTNGDRLENAEVIILNKDTGAVIYEGKLPVEGLKMKFEAGNYSITETKSPDGYQLSDKEYLFTINENGLHTGLVVLDAALSLELVNKKVVPMIPLEPSKPIVPMIPLEPSKPIVPMIPLEPSKPIVPMIPLEPSTPIVPMIPLEPSTPIKPDVPEIVVPTPEPVAPVVPTSDIPAQAPTALIALVALMSTFAVVLKKKED